jgi:hypothetical protein
MDVYSYTIYKAGKPEELDGPTVSALRWAIAEVKQHWLVRASEGIVLVLCIVRLMYVFPLSGLDNWCVCVCVEIYLLSFLQTCPLYTINCRHEKCIQTHLSQV